MRQQWHATKVSLGMASSAKKSALISEAPAAMDVPGPVGTAIQDKLEKSRKPSMASVPWCADETLPLAGMPAAHLAMAASHARPVHNHATPDAAIRHAPRPVTSLALPARNKSARPAVSTPGVPCRVRHLATGFRARSDVTKPCPAATNVS